MLVVQRIRGFGARIEELSAQARGAKPRGPSKRLAIVTDPAGNSRSVRPNGVR
jgi:hypothetical protein